VNKLKIIVRNTHFSVSAENKYRYANIISRFNNNLVTYKSIYNSYTKKYKTVEDRRFYYHFNKNTYNYSIHLLDTFIIRAIKSGIFKEDITVIQDTNYQPDNITVKVGPTYTDREHQPVYIAKAIDTNPMVLVDLKTGLGKTYISMRVVCETGYRTAIIILSRYIDKWIGDIKELTTATDDDIYVVQGKDSLAKLINNEDRYNFVIFSLSTLRNYIKTYDKCPDICTVSPEDLFKHLGIGTLINDEVHQSFHAVYMTTIRLNPMKTIALSATLDNLDRSIKQMYATLYPISARCGQLVLFDTYPIVIAANYYIDNPEVVKYMGPRGYSHIVFEQWLMRRSIFRTKYLEMILHYATKGYTSRRRKGDKLLILVQTVMLATLVVNYLKTKIKGLVINRYVEEDPYENIINSDISVSTNLSAGVALDIPSLITVIQTVSMKSLQMNVQALGRLRKIDGMDVRYYYIYSSNIPIQYRLHKVRMSVIRHLAKEYKFEEYPVRLNGK